MAADCSCRSATPPTGPTPTAAAAADPGLDGDGRLSLDFNFAYTPSCAWNDAYVCPLPPVQNRLRVAIRVGEKLPASRL